MAKDERVYRVRIRGEFACFSRPEFVERVSSEIITPSAARGVVEAVLWKPAIRYEVRQIALLRPIRFIQIKRNEVNSKAYTKAAASAAMGGGLLNDYFADGDRAQRNTVALKDVDYAITFSMQLTRRQGPDDNINKFDEMLRRRLERGQQHYQPYLGTREFPAIIEPDSNNLQALDETRDLGLMLHDVLHGPPLRAIFFEARMNRGIVDVPPLPAEVMTSR